MKWQKTDQNWSMLPHQFINDILPVVSTVSELKVILYILRHTWGFQEDSKRITLDEFQNGRKRKDGTRLDNGVGLSKQSIITGLENAEKHGYIEVDTDDSDRARIKKTYRLSFADDDDNQGSNLLTSDVQTLDIGGLNFRHRTEKETTETNLKKDSLSSDDDPDSLKDETKTRNKLIGDMIKAWFEAQPATTKRDYKKQFQIKQNRDVMGMMVDDGYTPEQISRYVKAKGRPDYFVHINSVRDNFIGWIDTYGKSNATGTDATGLTVEVSEPAKVDPEIDDLFTELEGKL